MKYSEVDCLRPVNKMETTGESRDYWRLEIQCGRLLETSRDKGDCRDHGGA